MARVGARCLSPPWVHTCIDHADLEELVLLVPSVLSGSYTLLRPRPQGSLGPEEGFDGDILFRAEHSKVSCPLHTVRLWVSVLVPICCKRKLLQWWLRKPLIYEYSRMSPWVHLLLCSFHRTVVFGFILGPWDSYTQVLCNQAVLGRGSMSWSKP